MCYIVTKTSPQKWLLILCSFLAVKPELELEILHFYPREDIFVFYYLTRSNFILVPPPHSLIESF